MPIAKYLPQEFWDDLSPQQSSNKPEPKPTRKRVKRAAIPRERKHKATESKPVGGFTKLTNTFMRDGTLSPDAKSVALVLASRANYGTGLVSVKPEDLQKESNMGGDRVKAGREELVKTEYVKRIRITDKKGHFKGVKYYATNKLVHRENKPLPQA